MASKTLAQTSIFLAPAASIFMAGYSYAFSQNAVPHLYDERPHHSVPIFTKVFYSGANVAIPLGVTSGLMSAYLAYLCKSSEQRTLYVIAAVATLATGPFTSLIMGPGIKRLIQISESTAVMDKSEQSLEHRQLLIKWVRQNYFRGTMFLVGGVVGLYAAIFG